MNELYQFTIIDYTTNPLGVPTLIDEPIGWDGVEFELTRLETHGFVNKINIDGINFEFRDVAKSILDTAYENYGVDAKIELQIEWRGNPSNSFQIIYKGLFKLNTYEVVYGVECYAKCGIVQDGCYHLFANRKNKSVDLSSVVSFDGSVLTGYANLNRPITIPPKQLLFENKYETNALTYNYQQGTFKGGSLFGAEWVADNIFLAIPHETRFNDEIIDNLTIGQMANGDNTDIDPSGFNKGSIHHLTNEKLFTPQLVLENDKRLRCEDKFTLTMDIDLDLNLFCNVFEDFRYSFVQFQAFLYNPSIPVSKIILYNGTQIPWGFLVPPTFNRTDTITESFTITDFVIPEGYFLFYGISYVNVWRKFFNQNFDITATIRKYDFNLSNLSECAPSEAKMSLVNETLSRQVEAYTNDCIRVKSDYFGRTDSDPYPSLSDGCGALECLLSGLQVRGAYDEVQTEYPLRASFDYIYEGLNKIHCLGYGLEDDATRAGYKWLRIEPFKYFYQNTTILTCDFPNLVTKKVNSDNIFSRIFIGYNKWESTEAGGLQDIYTEREYQTNLTRANKEIDLRSDLIASDFALEVTRRLYGITKIDWTYDNDIFILCIKRGSLIYEVEVGTDIINSANYIVGAQTLKNARISPIRNLLRHIPRLVEFVKPSLTYLFGFLNGKANYVAEMSLNTNTCVLEDITNEIAENASLDINTYDSSVDGEPIMVSEEIEFSYPLNCSEWATILANPYGKVEYNCPNDITYKQGYIKQLKFNPTQGIAKITLKKAYA